MDIFIAIFIRLGILISIRYCYQYKNWNERLKFENLVLLIQTLFVFFALGFSIFTLQQTTETIKGFMFVQDTSQQKYRASYTLTTGDTIWQDTAYGNFSGIYIGYSDTGTTLTDSITIELWDALLSVWKPVGAINMWNDNFYSYISPGAGETGEYKLEHNIIDIFRFRLMNTEYVAGRTGKISWTGKANK